MIARFNEHCEEKDRVSFQEMYMHNADGDMETLLDMFSPGDRRVAQVRGPHP